MIVSKKKILIIVLHIIFMIFAFFILQEKNAYHEICVIGTIFVGIAFFFNVIFEKKFVSPSNVILLCFILFQFGLPFLNAIDSSYENWYINQFSYDSLIYSVRISVICIQAFALGLIFSSKRRKEEIKEKKGLLYFDDSNEKNIYGIAKIIYIISAVIAIPLGFYVVYLALKNGYTYIKEDNMHIYNGLTRFAQQMIIPSNLLLIIYSKTKSKKKLWTGLIVFYSALLLFTGARTTSLAVFLVLLLIKREKAEKKNNVRKIMLRILEVFLGFSVLFLGVFVANYRYDGSITEFSISGVIESVIQEMGFNFTSLLFTNKFVPGEFGYKYGISYLYSFICLIPRTIDPTGLIDKMHYFLPETWLANLLIDRFGNLYKFGVGYSVIAESFYNFGSFGFIAIFLQGLIIGAFINKYNSNNKFSVYIKYVMLFSLITYPRRSFIMLLKSIEYCVVFMMILIVVYSMKKGKLKNENNNNLS